jgi:acetyl-CoA carboxylase biotin carboxyl carrier protein
MSAKGSRSPVRSIDAAKCSSLVRELAALLEETGLSEIEVEQDGMRLRVARAGAAVRFAPDPAAPVKSVPEVNEEPAAPHPGTVTSPMVGTVYVSPQPGAPPFIKAGDEVKEGQTILIVEAMKTMNPIPAPRGGKVIEIFVHDAQPVEFGEPLLVIG